MKIPLNSEEARAALIDGDEAWPRCRCGKPATHQNVEPRFDRHGLYAGNIAGGWSCDDHKPERLLACPDIAYDCQTGCGPDCCNWPACKVRKT